MDQTEFSVDTGRESHLACSSHPWRTRHARVRGLRTQRLPLAAPGSATIRTGQRWLAFLRNHREAIAAMDFFSVPTFTFNVLYVFFLIGHVG